MRRLLLPVLLAATCTSASTPDAKTEPAKREAPKAEPAEAEPAKDPTKADPAKSDPAKPEPVADMAAPPKPHACAKDDECMASCRHGAVSRAWHTKAYPGGEACEDGCTSKGTEAPRCEAGACVAYRAGARDPACTGVDAEPIAGPGPAHRCATDGDCVTTCAHGAVNKEWLTWQKPTECGGGCTNPGHQAPKCEAGRCVAYRDGKPQASCTERPVDR